MAKKRLALLTGGWWEHSHADVIAAKILKGYAEDDGEGPDLDIVSVWIDDPAPRGRWRGDAVCEQAGIPVFATAPEALREGIDGVLLLCNQSMLEPRPDVAWRAVFDRVDTGNPPVPVYSSKTISGPSFYESKAAYDGCKQRGIPLMAFSGYVVAHRDGNLGMGRKLRQAAAAGASNAANQLSFPHFGIHTLQCLQSQMERRQGGETGVKAVRCMSGPDMWKDFDAAASKSAGPDPAVLGSAVHRLAFGDYRANTAKCPAAAVLIIEYLDGTLATVAHLDGHYLPSGPTGEAQVAFTGDTGGSDLALVTFESRMDPKGGTWEAVTRTIDAFMNYGIAPVPPERTLLTDGIMNAALRSRVSDGIRLLTPELAIAYPASNHAHFPPFHLMEKYK